MNNLIGIYKDIITESQNDIVTINVKYLNYNGETKNGQIEVNKSIERDTKAVFDELYDIGFPINSVEKADKRPDVELIRNNITSAYNYRFVAGTKTLSKHAEGLAIDLNPKVNPAKPSTMASAYDESIQTGKITQEVINIFKKHGFRWGGEIFKGFYDAHHFEQ